VGSSTSSPNRTVEPSHVGAVAGLHTKKCVCPGVKIVMVPCGGAASRGCLLLATTLQFGFAELVLPSACTGTARSLACDAAPDGGSLHFIQQTAMHLTVARTAKADQGLIQQQPVEVAQSITPELAPEPHEASSSESTTTTLDPTGMTLNAEGDLEAFVAALFTNLFMALFCLVLFMFFRRHYPLMYAYNVTKGTAPTEPDSNVLWSWLPASLSADRKDWVKSVGLDQCMVLEFTHLAMKITAAVGVPMFVILGTLHWTCGGNAAGGDHMSYFSVGNVEEGSWLFWIHPFVVWAVVVAVKLFIFQAQKDFVHMRFEWMQHMADIRANTILVGGISKNRRSDKSLKEFFGVMFPGEGRVKEAYVVKDTRHLPGKIAQWKAAKTELYEAEQRAKDSSLVARNLCGCRKTVYELSVYRERMVHLWEQIKDEREEILTSSAKSIGSEGYNCTNGFVTFTNRPDAEIALRMDAISKDQDKWELQTPPEPRDLLWNDLSQDPTAEQGREIIGYALIAGLYVIYMPLVIGLSRIAQAVSLGPLQPFWESLAPTFGLQFMVAFLPTFIKLIIGCFFTLKAEAFAQHRLQVWYFWFQVVFVLLATAVGQHILKFGRAIATSPLAVFEVMGKTMPFATHFYMNFMVLQWSAHFMNMLRYVNLSKYLALKALYPEDRAAQLSEPEDQDYYGVGSRSARAAINLILGLVFGTICPPMYILTFVNFLICRIVYGYLIPYAETRKPDLGGYFWVTQLRHIFIGLVFYVMLMVGVLYERAPNSKPSWIAAAALVYVFWALHRFDHHFAWERLPFKYVVTEKELTMAKHEVIGHYQQPELFADFEEIKSFMQEHGLEATKASSSS